MEDLLGRALLVRGPGLGRLEVVPPQQLISVHGVQVCASPAHVTAAQELSSQFKEILQNISILF